MSLSDISCKPKVLPCCNEPSTIIANGEYLFTVDDRARNCIVRFRWLVDGRIDIPNCACSCYRANILYGANALRDFIVIAPIGYPVFVLPEPRVNVTTEGECANFTFSPFVDIPKPCAFDNIRNITFNNLCVNGRLNFVLDNINNTCGDTVTLLGSFDFTFSLTITYLPNVDNLHYELNWLYHLEYWLVSSPSYIVILIAGYVLFASVCYIHYQEYDPFNTKEDYEVLSSLFIGNDLREQDHDIHILKQLIISRNI
jgi:hypothetical protein